MTRRVEVHAAAGIDSQPTFTFTLDMRYVGQAFEVQVPIDPDALERLGADDLAGLFAKVHILGYGFGGTVYGACEIMSFRVGALAPPSELPALREAGSSSTGTACEIFDQDEWHDGRLARFARIDIAGGLSGPALVEGANSTIFIPRSWNATMDSHYNFVIETMDES